MFPILLVLALLGRGETIKQSDAQITIQKIEVNRVFYKHPVLAKTIDNFIMKSFKVNQTPAMHLIIHIDVKNTNKLKKMNYKGCDVQLRTPFGKVIKEQKLDPGDLFVDKVYDVLHVSPEGTIADLIIFELPNEDCDHLLLEVSDGDGQFMFRLPKNEWHPNLVP